jgi:hypothetical protein
MTTPAVLGRLTFGVPVWVLVRIRSGSRTSWATVVLLVWVLGGMGAGFRTSSAMVVLLVWVLGLGRTCAGFQTRATVVFLVWVLGRMSTGFQTGWTPVGWGVAPVPGATAGDRSVGVPDARDHRAAAISVEHAIAAISGVRAQLSTDRADPGLRGGPLAALIDRSFGVALANLDHVHRCCAALIDELHRRAALCDQYAEEMQRFYEQHRSWSKAVARYERALDDLQRARRPGAEPQPPAPPFAGAEVG